MKNIIYSLITVILLTSPLVMFPAGSADTGNKENKTVTFTKDVAPIFFKNCAECHRPAEAAPMSLLSYKDARPWAKSIREKVVNREMPPWHADPRHGEFKNDRRLTQQEIDTIAAWADGGAKEGDPRDLPPAPAFFEGWRIGKPDQVLRMPEEYTLEATGPDEYQYFTIPTNFSEDRYVQAAEARPGNRKIVHHIVAFIEPPSRKANVTDGRKRDQAEEESIIYNDGFVRRVKADAPVYNDGCRLPNGGGGSLRDGRTRNPPMTLLTNFAPGTQADVWGNGVVKRIPAGANIILQVHYSKAAGSVQQDRSSLGLIFAKEPHSRLQTTELVYNAYIQIPPGAERHKAAACWTAPDDIQLTAIVPHMHFRGAAMEVKAVYPDAGTAVLLNVPKYDFSWQTKYSLKQPLAIPQGTMFVVTGYFDNSAKNKYNPDPSKAIRYGDPTYDEMLACFLEYTR
jgi:Copper type II ascorbate-dependent monooxygenase, C-terminal domain